MYVGIARTRNIIQFHNQQHTQYQLLLLLLFFFSSSILHWAVHQPIAFHNFEFSRGSSNQQLNNYVFISDAISHLCMCTNHLATKQLFKIAELDIRLWAWRQGDFVIHCRLSVWTKPGQWFFSQYCIHLLRKPVRTDFLLCYKINGKRQLKYAPAAKKWHKQD